MRALRRSSVVLAGGGVACALALTSGPSGVQAAGQVIGPSGRPAVSMSFAAGHNPVAEHEDPVPALPDAGIADLDTVADQLGYARQAAALPVSQPGSAWHNVGPFGQDDPATYPSGGLRFARGAGMGVSAAVDRRDPSGNTVYVGAMGGLWKSTDAGRTWKALGDGTFARSGVGAVALDPYHPGDVYAGTGIALATLSGDTPGVGVYVSHDDGAHWTRATANTKGYGVNAITPTPSGVLVGTSNGLYLTRDRGGSFARVALKDNASHTAPATGAYANWVTAIVMNPRKPAEITVAVGLPYGKRKDTKGNPLSPGNGLYRTTGGAAGSFSYLASSSLLRHTASSTDPLGRIVLAYGTSTATETPVLWAIVQDAGLLNGSQPAGLDIVSTTTGESTNVTNTLLNGLYRSDDDGLTWNVKATPQSLTSSPNEGLGVYPALGYGVGVQAFYNLWLQVDPRNSDQVYFGLEEVFESIAGTQAGPGLGQFDVIQKYWDVCGSTTYFENIYTGTTCPDATPYYGGPATHPDQHVGAIASLPGNKIRLYTGNDGGFFREDSSAQTTGGQFDQDHWSDMNHLASVQPYHVARTPDGHYVTALQDNGGGVFKAGGSNKLISSGDGVWAIATSDPKTFYTSAQGAVLYVTRDGGAHIKEIQPDLTGANFTSPIAMDPTDENHLVAAGTNLQETTKGPDTTTLIDPLLYTVVSTDWTTSYDAGASPTKNPSTGDPVDWTSQALAVRGAAVYDGICALCRNALGDPTLIRTTVATNVGKAGCTPKKASTACWHTAAGRGLPHVAIQGMVIDPADVKTVYVALNENANIGYDHKVVGSPRIMVSHDAGQSFRDITGNLPRNNARDLVIRNGQLIAATDNGVFTAPLSDATHWKRLGTGLPAVRIYDLDLDRTGRYLSVGAYGRGVWTLDFGAKATVSSSGPGQHGGLTPTKARSGTGNLAATGLGTGLPLAALGLLLVGSLGLARRRRS
jgi:photosystem II stability/assembly factor-like uncharacterized protein